jgi:hypothetical protein
MIFLSLADGKMAGDYQLKVRAIAAGPDGSVAACTPNGVAAYRGDGTFIKAFGRSKGCDTIRANGSGFNAGLFPVVFGVNPVASW